MQPQPALCRTPPTAAVSGLRHDRRRLQECEAGLINGFVKTLANLAGAIDLSGINVKQDQTGTLSVGYARVFGLESRHYMPFQFAMAYLFSKYLLNAVQGQRVLT